MNGAAGPLAEAFQSRPQAHTIFVLPFLRRCKVNLPSNGGCKCRSLRHDSKEAGFRTTLFKYTVISGHVNQHEGTDMVTEEVFYWQIQWVAGGC